MFFQAKKYLFHILIQIKYTGFFKDSNTVEKAVKEKAIECSALEITFKLNALYIFQYFLK